MNDSIVEGSLSSSVNGVQTSRRSFLKASVGVSGGFSLGFGLTACSSLDKSRITESGDWSVNAWLEIRPDNEIIFTLDRVEMGQGTYTGMTTLLAEELDVEPSTIKVKFAPVAPEYRNPDYAVQVTGGSNSISSAWIPLREAGAAANQMLKSAAAELWGTDEIQLITLDKFVIQQSTGKKISYGELAKLAANQSVPSSPKLKPASEFKYIGKQSQRLDSTQKVTGTAEYGIDSVVEGMRYAVVVHSPTFGGNVGSFNGAELEGNGGVERVVQVEAGVAIVADSYWRARKAVQKLRVDWIEDPEGPKSTQQIFDLYRRAAAEDDGNSGRSEGDAEKNIATSSKIIEREFEAPFLAHATMEPMNCVARVQKGKADIWCSTQAPDIARVAAARVTDLSLDEITIHNKFIGGGFGRRLIQDFVAEAAEISYKTGLPIKLVWSREDDTQNDYFRPASYHKMTAAFDDEGNLTAWDHHTVVPKLLEWFVWDAAPAMMPFAPKFMYPMMGRMGLWTEGTPLTPADMSPFEGADDVPYDIPNIEVRHTKADAGVPVSYWRSVGHSHNGYVVEAFVDELAYEVKQDPVEFRRKLLSKHPRHLNVLNLVAEASDWSAPLPEGVFRGIALHKSFKSYVAQVAEIELVGSQIKVRKVYCAVDCGTIVNPDVVKMQMESGIIFGITAALYGEITIEGGRVQQSNFHDYQMLRMNESPDIEVIMVESDESPTGVGEPGLPPIAPAIGNALFAATGKRHYSLPLKV